MALGAGAAMWLNGRRIGGAAGVAWEKTRGGIEIRLLAFRRIPIVSSGSVSQRAMPWLSSRV